MNQRKVLEHRGTVTKIHSLTQQYCNGQSLNDKKKKHYELKDRTIEMNKSKKRREKATQLQRHRDKENIKQSNNYIKYKWTNYSNQKIGLDKKKDIIIFTMSPPDCL